MLAFRRCSHGVTHQLSLSRPFFLTSLCHLFTKSTKDVSTASNQTLVDFLINSIGFSKSEALSVSAKVPRLNSIQNPNSILNLLKEYHLDNTHVRILVKSSPRLLNRKYENLEPKFRALSEIGLSKPDFAKYICRDPYYLNRGFDSYIVPTINYLRELVGSDENLVEAIKKSRWLLSYNYKYLLDNVSVMRSYGFSHERITKFIIEKPRFLMRKTPWLEEKVIEVEEKLGISRDSKMFFYGLQLVGSGNDLIKEKKHSLLRKFGWSDKDILTLAKASPMCLTLSEAKLQKGLGFFMKELGYTTSYLVTCPFVLTLSLEKRVIPRNIVVNILKEKKLLKSTLSLRSFLAISELKFVNDYVTRYKDEIPNLYEIYTTSKGQQKKMVI